MQTHIHTHAQYKHMKKDEEKKLWEDQICRPESHILKQWKAAQLLKGIFKSSTPDNLPEAQSGLAHTERDPSHGSSPLFATGALACWFLVCREDLPRI